MVRATNNTRKNFFFIFFFTLFTHLLNQIPYVMFLFISCWQDMKTSLGRFVA